MVTVPMEIFTNKKTAKRITRTEKKNILLMFKENVEEFMDLDGEMIGPFDKGEIANLPENITKIFVDSGKAEVVED